MKTVFILFFFLFGLLQFGILLNTWMAHQPKYRVQSLHCWSIALLMCAGGYWAFAIALAVSVQPLGQDSGLITIANTLIFGSVLFQGMFPRALRQVVPSKVFWLLIGAVLVYGAIFEAARPNTLESRTASVAIILFIVYLWQAIEIWITRKSIKSVHLNLLMAIVCVEAFCNLARAFAVYASSVQVLNLDQLPALVSLFLWTQITFNVLAYVTMNGYWISEMTTQNVSAEYENNKIRVLLNEKTELLNDLIKSKKMADLGALSASISHEINQPLAAIKLNAWSLKNSQEVDGGLSERQTKLIEQTVNDIDRVADIVSTLRLVFKTEEPVATGIDLHAFFTRLKPIIEPELKTREIAFEYQIPHHARVVFNESELTLVVLNIVNNAVNAGSKTIVISALSDGGQVRMTIADDGRGVDAELVPHLFEFGKASNAHGLGLGLWLSKYIMERGAGDIFYEPRKPKGSVFTIAMPSAD